jgi:hypothetical protein
MTGTRYSSPSRRPRQRSHAGEQRIRDDDRGHERSASLQRDEKCWDVTSDQPNHCAGEDERADVARPSKLRTPAQTIPWAVARIAFAMTIDQVSETSPRTAIRATQIAPVSKADAHKPARAQSGLQPGL